MCRIFKAPEYICLYLAFSMGLPGPYPSPVDLLGIEEQYFIKLAQNKKPALAGGLHYFGKILFNYP
jgi:hypothetical protein